jgi:N-acetylglucosaminyldiphosphoundecaprenol N-acetyl-beta-D-mannosaminyltransferase
MTGFIGQAQRSTREELHECSCRSGCASVFVELCGLPLTVGLSVSDAVELAFTATEDQLPVITTFINPHAFHLAKRDEDYAANLAKFTYVLPDGIGVTWGLRFLHGRRTGRISFDNTSLALPVLKRASRENRSIMLVGGRPGVAARAAERLAGTVKELRISAAISGFKSFDEYEAIVQSIRPDVIICGMGAPRQEDFLVRLAQSGIWKGVGYTCGGYFDQLQERLHYYPALVDQLNLRWLYRLAREPRRLWRRYAVEYQEFLGSLARESLHRRGLF